MEKDSKIKEKISYLRRGKKLSQEHMAHALKISLNSYRKLENGSTRIFNPRFEEIARILEVSTDYLLMDNAQPAPYAPNETSEQLIIENAKLKERIAYLEEIIGKLSPESLK